MSEMFAQYLPHIRRRWQQDKASWQHRRERAWERARRAAAVLRTHGASEVIAFGSLVGQGLFDEHSDIDLATSGIPIKQFFRAWADAAAVVGDFELDVVDMAECSPALLEKIRAEGVPL
jgi:predicted nucleotidyltransferase